MQAVFCLELRTSGRARVKLSACDLCKVLIKDILVCKTQNAMGLISFCSSSSGHPLHGLGHKAKPDISRLRNRHDIETINIDTLNHISSKEWQIRSQNFGITKQASPFQKIDLCLRGKLNSPARPSQVRKH